MSFITISRQRAFVQSVLAQDSAALAAQEAEIVRRTKLELAKLREKAEAEARAAIEAEALTAVAQRLEMLDQAAAALRLTAAQLAAPLAQKERELAELAVELGFILACHISGAGAANAEPASLHQLVSVLLAEANAARGARQILRLRLNPADFAQLKTLIAPEVAQLQADASIGPGGAVVEIICPEGDPVDKVEWDATLPGRFATMRAALALKPEPEAILKTKPEAILKTKPEAILETKPGAPLAGKPQVLPAARPEAP